MPRGYFTADNETTDCVYIVLSGGSPLFVWS